MRYAFRQRAWIGAPLAAALATGILLWWGFAVWAALLIALLLFCPALMIWGIIVTRRVPDLPGDIPPETRGMTLNWIAPVYD